MDGSQPPDPPGGPVDLDGTAVVDRIEATLAEVDSALERLDDGSFGLCRHCGQPIDAVRLSVDVLATGCADCDSA